MPVDVAGAPGVEVVPADVIAGLGACDRDALATGLALLEDTALRTHCRAALRRRADPFGFDAPAHGEAAVVDGLRAAAARRFAGDEADDALRLRLWIQLREAFVLPARVAVSLRSAERSADDVAAAAIHWSDPPQALLERHLAPFGLPEAADDTTPRSALAHALIPRLHALLARAAGVERTGAMSATERRQHAARLCTRLAAIDPALQADLHAATLCPRWDVEAVDALVHEASSIASIVAARGYVRCVPHVLAAQAGALMPVVSGAMVAAVSASLADPGNRVAHGVRAAWPARTRAADPVRVEIGLHVLALLALSGITAGRDALGSVLAAFSSAPGLGPSDAVDAEVLQRYRDDWALVAPAIGRRGPAPSAQAVALLGRPVFGGDDDRAGWLHALRGDPSDRHDARGRDACTLGDVLLAAVRAEVTALSGLGLPAGTLEAAQGAVVHALTRRVRMIDPMGPVAASDCDEARVAATVVAAHLLVRGHYVAPAGPPRSGAWPLTVDGRSVRVVCAPDAAALAERLAATGDVPVLVNAELAGTLPRALFARVCFVEGFSRARVMRIVEALHSALQPVAHGPRAGMASAAADADADADANASVPLFALAVAWARAPHDAGDARLSGMQAIELALLEGGLRSGLAVLGGFAGAGLGQLVFGPAAGSLFAERLPQWLGLLADEAGRAFDDLEGGPRDQAWAEDAARALDDLVARVHEALDARFACMKSAYDAIPAGPLHDALCAGIEEDNRSLREFRRRLEHAAAAAPTDPSAPSDPSDPSDPSAPSDPSGSSPPAGRPHSIPAVAHRIVAVLRLIADGTVHPVFHGAALGRLAVLLEQRSGASARRSGAVDDGLSDAVRGAVHDVLDLWMRAGLRTRF